MTAAARSCTREDGKPAKTPVKSASWPGSHIRQIGHAILLAVNPSARQDKQAADSLPQASGAHTNTMGRSALLSPRSHAQSRWRRTTPQYLACIAAFAFLAASVISA